MNRMEAKSKAVDMLSRLGAAHKEGTDINDDQPAVVIDLNENRIEAIETSFYRRSHVSHNKNFEPGKRYPRYELSSVGKPMVVPTPTMAEF